MNAYASPFSKGGFFKFQIRMSAYASPLSPLFFRGDVNNYMLPLVCYLATEVIKHLLLNENPKNLIGEEPIFFIAKTNEISYPIFRNET